MSWFPCKSVSIFGISGISVSTFKLGISTSIDALISFSKSGTLMSIGVSTSILGVKSGCISISGDGTFALTLYSPSKSTPFGFPKHDNPFDFGLPDTLPALTSNSGDLTAIDASALGSFALISPSGLSTFTSALALYSPSISAPFGFPKHDSPFDFGLPDTLPALTSNSGDLTAMAAPVLGNSAFISPS